MTPESEAFDAVVSEILAHPISDSDAPSFLPDSELINLLATRVYESSIILPEAVANEMVKRGLDNEQAAMHQACTYLRGCRTLIWIGWKAHEKLAASQALEGMMLEENYNEVT